MSVEDLGHIKTFKRTQARNLSSSELSNVSKGSGRSSSRSSVTIDKVALKLVKQRI